MFPSSSSVVVVFIALVVVVVVVAAVVEVDYHEKTPNFFEPAFAL